MQPDRLTLKDVDAYRNARLEEKTVRGTPPAPGTLDREVELLKRMLGYAVKSGQLKEHPLRGSSFSGSQTSGGWCSTRKGFQRPITIIGYIVQGLGPTPLRPGAQSLLSPTGPPATGRRSAIPWCLKRRAGAAGKSPPKVRPRAWRDGGVAG